MVESPKYGVLLSVRHKAKESNALVNAVSIKFGSSIKWRTPGDGGFDSCIWRKDLKDPPIYFKLHGNKFANSIEFNSQDITVLQAMKAEFPEVFVGEVKVKEGLC